LVEGSASLNIRTINLSYSFVSLFSVRRKGRRRTSTKASLSEFLLSPYVPSFWWILQVTLLKMKLGYYGRTTFARVISETW